MPKTIFKPNQKIVSTQLTNICVTLMQRYLPLDLQNTRLTAEDVWFVLTYAATQRQTIESACADLPQAPSGNRLREVLLAALPSPQELQRQLNTILRKQLHPSLFKKTRPFQIALDLTLIPYHGQPHRDQQEIMRGEAKSGTTHFHGYATVSIVHDKRRYVLALTFVQLGETMVTVARRLLDRVKRLKIKVRRLYCDAGFCNIPVLQMLERRQLAYIIPVPVRGKSGGIRELFVGHSRFQTYTMSSAEHGSHTLRVGALRRHFRDKKGKRRVHWFIYALHRLPTTVTLIDVYTWYRRRFGIETSYRQMNQVRARTTSRQPALRLLLVGLAFILVNLYVQLRFQLGVVAPCVSKQLVTQFLTLRRLALVISRAIEQQRGALDTLRCYHQIAFS